MSHEEKRATKIKKLMAKEKNEPLMIRVEPSHPMDLISTHRQLVVDPQSSPKYINDQAQAIARFEEMERLLGDDFIHACM